MGLFIWPSGKEVFLLASPLWEASAGARRYYFDGHGIWSHGLLSRAAIGHEAAAKIEKAIRTPCEGVGVFMLASIQRSGAFEVTLDGLSQYNLFFWRQGGSWLLSNSLHVIERFTGLFGAKVKRSLEVAVAEAAVGLAPRDLTGLADVSLIPADHMVQGDLSNGQIEMVPLRRFASSPISTDQAASSLKESLAVIQQDCLGKPVYDLTGGLDSRLVLAASQAAGQTQQHVTWDLDGAEHDTTIASQIAIQLHLQRVDISGNDLPSHIDACQAARYAVSRQQGHSTIYSFELGSKRVGPPCRVRGGMGEILRRIYSPSWGGMMPSHLVFRRKSKPYERFLTAGFKRKLLADIKSDLRDIRHQYDGWLDPLHVYYLTHRSRRHFGFTSQLLNLVRPAFEPLSSLMLWRYAMGLTRSERSSGKGLYRLMKALSPQLAQMAVHAPGLKGRVAFTLYRKASQAESYDPHVKDKSSTLETKRPMGHAVTLWPVREDFWGLILDQSPRGQIWDYLDRAAFEALYRTPDRDESLRRRSLFFLRLYYGVLWQSGQEQYAPILS